MIEDLNELKECINELPGDMDREVTSLPPARILQ